MAWSSSFLDHLASRATSPRFYFDPFMVGDAPGGAFEWMSSVELYAGGSAIRARIGSPLSSAGQSVTPVSWTSTLGSWVVPIVGDDALMSVLASTVRGQFARMAVGYGPNYADYETVGLGQVKDVRGLRPGYEVELWDVVSGFSVRPTANPTQLSLFNELPVSTTLTANFAAGDGTLTVNSTTGFYIDGAASAKGLLRVDPNNGDDPFYLKWTSKTGTVFTLAAGTGALNTTAVAAKVADVAKVYAVAYVSGHPFDVVRQILESTGGTPSGYDTLPKSWGLSFPAGFVDDDDIDLWKTLVDPASGSFTMDLHSEEPVTDPLGWIADCLARMGAWLVVRQGLVSIRAAQDPNAAASKYVALTIDDDLIASVESWSAFDPDMPAAYGRVWVQPNTAASFASLTTTENGTLPTSDTYTYDVSDYVYANENVVAQSIRDRVKFWTSRVPESLVIICAGMYAAQLVPGDIVDLTTTQASGRKETSTWGYDGRRAFVSEVSPDWTANTVRLTLKILPDWAGDFA